MEDFKILLQNKPQFIEPNLSISSIFWPIHRNIWSNVFSYVPLKNKIKIFPKPKKKKKIKKFFHKSLGKAHVSSSNCSITNIRIHVKVHLIIDKCDVFFFFFLKHMHDNS